MTPPHYMVRLPDGRIAYHLPSRGNNPSMYPTPITRWTTSDGTELEALQVTGWYAAPAGTTGTLYAHLAGGVRGVGWKLRNPAAATDVYPAQLSDEDYYDRADDDGDGGSYDPAVEALYARVTEEVPGSVVPVETDGWVSLDGEIPALPDGCSWKADLPYALSGWGEYSHLFPGKLTGYGRGLVAYVRRAVPGVEIKWLGHTTPEEMGVTVSREYVPPRAHRVDLSGPRARRPRYEDRPSVSTSRYVVSIGRTISGKNLADALAALEAFTARVVADLLVAVAEVPCGHCAGTGIAEPTAVGVVRSARL
jgi:hypothetical protein